MSVGRCALSAKSTAGPSIFRDFRFLGRDTGILQKPALLKPPFLGYRQTNDGEVCELSGNKSGTWFAHPHLGLFHRSFPSWKEFANSVPDSVPERSKTPSTQTSSIPKLEQPQQETQQHKTNDSNKTNNSNINKNYSNSNNTKHTKTKHNNCNKIMQTTTSTITFKSSETTITSHKHPPETKAVDREVTLRKKNRHITWIAN